jgi:large subunit ribosomal protein L18
LLRRIREDKTNYRKRKAILIGRHNFATVRVSNQNVQVQILKLGKKGDETLVSTHSRELMKYGWKGSRKSIPACYLTGLLAGVKALAKNVKECILYTGNRIYSPKIAASVKGLLDAGMNIPIEEETIPTMDRLNGKHIADYAKDLKEKDNQLYTARFSTLIKEGFSPENYAENVERTKSSILSKPLVKEKEKAETKPKQKEVEVETLGEEKVPKKPKVKPKTTKTDKSSEKKTAKKGKKGDKS